MKYNILLILVITITGSFFSQNVEFSSEIFNKKYGINDNIKVVYSLNQNAEIELIKNENFELIFGPSTSISSSINVTNGNQIQNTKKTETYIFKASKTGKLILPKAKVIIDNIEYFSPTSEVDIVEGSINPENKVEDQDIQKFFKHYENDNFSGENDLNFNFDDDMMDEFNEKIKDFRFDFQEIMDEFNSNIGETFMDLNSNSIFNRGSSKNIQLSWDKKQNELIKNSYQNEMNRNNELIDQYKKEIENITKKSNYSKNELEQYRKDLKILESNDKKYKLLLKSIDLRDENIEQRIKLNSEISEYKSADVLENKEIEKRELELTKLEEEEIKISENIKEYKEKIVTIDNKFKNNNTEPIKKRWI